MLFFKKYYILFIVYLLFLGVSHDIKAQSELIASAKTAIKSGDAKKLSSYFNSLIELNFDDEKESYSKGEAEQVLSTFFQKYPAVDFRYIHQGASKQGLQYAIGKYTYNEGSFRVYILVKQEESGKYIIDTLDFGEE